MNERIKELKHQAMIFKQEKCNENNENLNDFLYNDIMLERFAELIVEDCIKSIESTHKKINHTEWELGAEWGHKNSVNLVKKHFGVK